MFFYCSRCSVELKPLAALAALHGFINRFYILRQVGFQLFVQLHQFACTRLPSVLNVCVALHVRGCGADVLYLSFAAFAQPGANAISANGCTALGEALALLANRVDAEVTKSTMEKKGDWKPLVFIMTDGEPTDDLNAGLAEFKKRKFGMVVACAAGQGANTETLKKITDCVVQLDTADSATIKSFFKWVSASVSAGSMKVEDTGTEMTSLSELPPPPPEVNIVV